MDNNALGKAIRKARGDLSLRDYAKKIGISHTHLDSIEKGYDPRTGKPVTISLDTFVKLSDATGIPLEELLSLFTCSWILACRCFPNCPKLNKRLFIPDL